MLKKHLFATMVVCLALAGSAAWAQSTPSDAVAQAVASNEAFPAGTSVVSVTVDGASAVVDLSAEAAPADLGDTQSDNMVKAIVDALSDWPEITAIEVTVADKPLWQYLPPPTQGEAAPAAPEAPEAPAGPMMMMAMAATVNPNDPIPATSSELSGKMIALHPSHGSYWLYTQNGGAGGWLRAQRTRCGPNPVTNIPPGVGPAYMPSDYYFWTMGYQWPMYYEDDMSPETIRFVKAYLESSSAEVWCSRNLDKNAGNFPVPYNGKYPNCSFPLPKWQTAAKYYLEDRGDIPEWVWNEPSLPRDDDKDIRARAYYANYRMSLKYPGQPQNNQAVWGNCLSFSLHSNAASTGSPPQAQARGTETYWYTSTYPYLQTKAVAYCTAVDAKVINAIRNLYDGTWAEAMYPATYPSGTYPPEWVTAYGAYRGYQQAGNTNTRWQDRGVKTSNFGEIRECKMPAQLMELLFHDDWKFYPDVVFHEDQIFRSTVAWGIYEGMCQYWGITPKARLAATLVSADFPAWVQPNSVINGSVTMQNLGQAWCWGNKFTVATKTYGPYTVWRLAATANDQIAPGGKTPIDPGAVILPGDTATFSLPLTAPAAEGVYTTQWRMLKDDARGGAFGDTATAQIGVDGTAPVIAITAPTEGLCSAASVAVQFDVSDALSGVASVAADVNGTPVSSGDTLTLATGAYTLTVNATDNAGNTATQAVSFNVDATAPVIVIGSPSAMEYPYGTIAVQFEATDAGCSGLASVTGKVDGQPVTSGQNLPLLPLGTHTLVVTAVDGDGNTTTESVTFTVVNVVGKFTAGGWIPLPEGKGNFSVHVAYATGGNAPSGEVNYQDHGTKMKVDSDQITALGVVGSEAIIGGTCTIDGEPGHTFQVVMIDLGEPGSRDAFWIFLDTGYTAGGTIGGGNIQMH